jgi:radical SAM superfamily enzyme YgiQ (UPF0313 family)
VATRKKDNRYPYTSLLSSESGTIFKEAGAQVALGYPAPYSVAVSSLGFQTVYRTFNQSPGLSCNRFFFEANAIKRKRLVAFETGRPITRAAAYAFSIACETELYQLVELLLTAGLNPLADLRDDNDPPVIIGGPLTDLDPRLVAPLADVVVVGEAEESLPAMGKALNEVASKNDVLEILSKPLPGVWIPSLGQAPPEPAEAPIDMLPAKAATWSQYAEFKNLYLVETVRGCKRACSFCVLSARRDSKKKFRPVPVESILDSIPKDAPGVGLVGAAVTDHPEIEHLVGSIVDSGRRVSLASIRADSLTENLARLLVKGGLRTITLAADGLSDSLRKTIHKGVSRDDLVGAAAVASSAGIRGVKLYVMVGLPGETDGDVEEFCDLALLLSRSLRVSIAAQAFVPKPGTPMAGEKMESEIAIKHRLELMKKLLKGRAKLMPTSPRWSFVDWKLAHAGFSAAHVAIRAQSLGGGFSAWKRAIEEAGI